MNWNGSLSRIATLRLAAAPLAFGVMAAPASAQERIPIDISEPKDEDGSEPETSKRETSVDVLAETRAVASDRMTRAQERECEEAMEAGEISGEIVVCGKLIEKSGGYDAWLKDYAERTKYRDAPPPPDVDGSGLPAGMAPLVTIKACFIPPCPKDPVLYIDVEALPEPPVGSDAYWLAKGIVPRDERGELTPEAKRILEGELGLPPVPDFGRDKSK